MNKDCMFFGLCVLLLVFGCKNGASNQGKATQASVVKAANDYNVADSLLPNAKDKIYIIIDSPDTISFATRDVKQYIQSSPELTQSIADNPDIAYAITMADHSLKAKDGSSAQNRFASEAGQDAYFALYSYFLRNKNGTDRYSEERKKLLNIYRNINELNGRLLHGGTYYGHQYSRILAYAEYSIYKYSSDSDNYKKEYDLSAQKKLFLDLLKRKIDDELKANNDFPNNAAKTKEKEDLYKIVNDLDTLTTNYFYLKEGEAFNFGYYN